MRDRGYKPAMILYYADFLIHKILRPNYQGQKTRVGLNNERSESGNKEFPVCHIY
jgi:hypothetical protein